MTKELVIAVYDKDYSFWVDRVNHDVKRSIYRKGNAKPLSVNEIRIEPHIGRDIHTFFWHILHRYETLSDVTFFAQDFPFDHWGKIVEDINSENFTKCTIQINGFYGHYTPVIDTGLRLVQAGQFNGGSVLKCLSNGLPHDGINGVNVNKFWDELFLEEKPTLYEFLPAVHCAITKEQILKRSKEFYNQIVNLLEQHKEAPWSIERLFLYIFDERFKAKY